MARKSSTGTNVAQTYTSSLNVSITTKDGRITKATSWVLQVVSMTATIGSRKIAQQLHSSRGQHLSDDWEMIGEGSFREVWLHKPTNVVYKRCTYTGLPGYDSKVELRNAKRLAKKSFTNVRIPKTSGYKFGHDLIIAMEYIEGKIGMDIRGEGVAGRLELYKCGFEDMHPLNFIVTDDEKVVPIDMASPMHKDYKTNADIRVMQNTPEYPKMYKDKFGESPFRW